MVYTPPSGSAIVFAFVETYVPPAGDAIVFGAPPAEPVPQTFTPDFAVPWQQLPVRDAATRDGWNQARALVRSLRSGWKQRKPLSTDTRSGWMRPHPSDNQRAVSWDQLRLQASHDVDSPWNGLRTKDRIQRLPWEKLAIHSDQALDLVYAYPPRKHIREVLVYEHADRMDAPAFESPWGNPPPKDRRHHTLWGRKYYQEICWRKYAPPAGGAIRFNLDKPLSQVGDADHVAFYFDQYTYDRRCSWREPSGWRDAYFYTEPDAIPAGPVKRFYFVLNSALLTRLPERTAIDVASITVATDVDSFCWSLSATLNSTAALDLLRPGAPVDVEVNINGHLFILQVERWNEGRQFIGGSRSVSGRSRSSSLAAPAGPIITRTESNNRTAVQLAEAALDDVAGWTIDWDLVDWLIPGGLWSCNEQTPIQILQDIAEAGHGFVQTDATTKTIQIKPRYSVMPWLWASSTPDLIIPESMILSMDGSWEPKTQYNAAFVSGTGTGGITAKVTRAGTAGDVAAPMFTHALITDTDVALAKGRGLLAASGYWELQRLTIPLFASPAVPGLVLPGALLRVTKTSGSFWNGQVIGTSVTASRTRGGVVVRQTLDVERYHGD
jgi:hypothetical protein